VHGAGSGDQVVVLDERYAWRWEDCEYVTAPREVPAMFLLFVSCVVGAPPNEPLTATQQQADDIAAYQDLQAELDENRSRFSEVGPTELYAYGRNLFWLD
jgi:hypothetical protein